MVVVLVDGIWGKGAVFGRLRARLETEGHRCLVPVLQPNNAAHGLADLAEKLKRTIDSEVGTDAPLAIVGFSMGCIVARIYLQELGGQRRTALSSPSPVRIRERGPPTRLLVKVRVTYGRAANCFGA